MFDIHMHLLPGVDDGAREPEMSLEMIRIAKSEGIRAIVATPHSGYVPPAVIRKILENLKESAARAGLDLPLYPGCEVYCSDMAMDSILSMLSGGKLLSLNDTRYVLTEFNPYTPCREAGVCLERLKAEGWNPVIAHAERHLLLAQEESFYREMVDMGCLIQCNAYSFAQERKPEIRNYAHRLAAEEMIHFLGTDAHRPDHRPPMAAVGLRWLREHTGEDYFRRITEGNARELLGMG